MWAENYFHLLLECFKYWNDKANGQKTTMPRAYAEVFNDLRSKGVSFPVEKKFIDWPKPGDEESLANR